eukprot:768550-Hanusia_phi.AAC.5
MERIMDGVVRKVDMRTRNGFYSDKSESALMKAMDAMKVAIHLITGWVGFGAWLIHTTLRGSSALVSAALDFQALLLAYVSGYPMDEAFRRKVVLARRKKSDDTVVLPLRSTQRAADGRSKSLGVLRARADRQAVPEKKAVESVSVSRFVATQRPEVTDGSVAVQNETWSIVKDVGFLAGYHLKKFSGRVLSSFRQEGPFGLKVLMFVSVLMEVPHSRLQNSPDNSQIQAGGNKVRAKRRGCAVLT